VKDYRNAEGFLTVPEREYLYRLAKEVPDTGLILEIGGEFGASTTCLRAGAKAATIVTIDLFPKNLIVQHLKNLAEVGITDTLQFRGDSKIIGPLWQTSLDLLFIDGGHTYSVVKSDIAWFTLWVKPGCVVAFHDHYGTHPLHAEVRRAVAEWVSTHRPDTWAEVPAVDSIRAFRRQS